MTRAWQVYSGWVVLAAAVGASWGLYRGIKYDTVVWAAPAEGSLLFGLPAALLGLLPAGLANLAVALRHRARGGQPRR